jgi:hypothetical protein
MPLPAKFNRPNKRDDHRVEITEDMFEDGKELLIIKDKQFSPTNPAHGDCYMRRHPEGKMRSDGTHTYQKVWKYVDRSGAPQESMVAEGDLDFVAYHIADSYPTQFKYRELDIGKPYKCGLKGSVITCSKTNTLKVKDPGKCEWCSYLNHKKAICCAQLWEVKFEPGE